MIEYILLCRLCICIAENCCETICYITTSKVLKGKETLQKKKKGKKMKEEIRMEIQRKDNYRKLHNFT